MGLLNKVFVGELSASWGKAQGCRGSQSLQSTIDAGAWQPVSVFQGLLPFLSVPHFSRTGCLWLPPAGPCTYLVPCASLQQKPQARESP